ncbi:hypothetical protein [uncultured Microbacterium sp.]|uniref:hypothetical protein n=1 Tax=uncultured Microbacterium sp. TaxID=191216 RepID=UPI002607FF10|nr:hypothetical protein [uncultured Microbacterium sp.]
MARQIDLGKLARRADPTAAPAATELEQQTEQPAATTVPAEAPAAPVGVEPTPTAKKPAPRKQPSRTARTTAEDEDDAEGEERETATKGVPVHLPVPLNDRLQAYMTKTRKSHQTVLLDAVSATYKRLPELIRQATAGGEETDEEWTDLFNRQKRPAPVTDAGPRVKHTVRVAPSYRAILDRVTTELDAPSRNFVIITAYEAFLPPLD